MKSQRAKKVDVAIQVGVSQAAISQELNWCDSIRRKEKRKRLLDTFDQLGNLLNSLTQRLVPSRYSCLVKIYKLFQHPKNLHKSIFKGKGGEILFDANKKCRFDF